FLSCNSFSWYFPGSRSGIVKRPLASIVPRAFDFLVPESSVKEVVRGIRHENPFADVDRCGTTGGRRRSSFGVEPLDIYRGRQLVASGRSGLPSRDAQEEPRNCAGSYEVCIGRGLDGQRPDSARVPRVLPGGSKHTGLLRVGAGKGGDDLF